MTEQGLVRINLMIGGRSYPVKVDKTEVPALKSLESTIQSKLNEFMIKYPNYERIDLLTMAFLSVLFEQTKELAKMDGFEIEKRLENLNQLLDKPL